MISAYREKDIDWGKVLNTFALENPWKMFLINIFDEEKEKDDLTLINNRINICSNMCG